MVVSVKLPEEFQSAYKHIFKQDLEKGTINLVIHELRRRLAEYRLMDKRFRERYKMNFDEFKQRRMVEEYSHSFEVEEDYCDWEIAIDGIMTVTAELKKLEKFT